MKKHGVLQKARIILLVCMAAAMAAHAQKFTTLHSFDGTDGSEPQASLVQATDGNLYGTTFDGGTNGDGTVFKISPSGALTTLHSFDGTDGQNPWAGVIQASNGNFYGTTLNGGAHTYGTIFEITSSGTLTTLHSFDWTDGADPWAGLIQASNGNFYGTTPGGGTNGGYGTVFKITSGGTLTTLHSFDSTDGNNARAGLIQASNGNFYGTTYEGGANGYGTVFKMTSSGTLTTLYNFCLQSNCTDGGMLTAGVIQGADGNFYGTTYEGGANGYGTVFKMTSSGKLTTLHSFSGADGVYPYGGLLQATDGNFYGTTQTGGGSYNAGTIFKITSSGTLTTLHSFSGADGQYPYDALIQDTNGTFYGTTQSDGAGFGTVFSLSEGLGPFVKILTTSGKEGAKVGMLGQGFSSSSVVKFGGTKATTIVLSGTTFITATVPAAALTGSVTVTTGTTTLTSTKTFDVLPTITTFTPESGPVGTPVTIKGTGLKQTTKVTFDGKSATFTVVSDTEITADVPTGAATGKISATTKGGSAASATSFTVN
jgi:uncharacterized repeat protein (TIGR03803 family)